MDVPLVLASVALETSTRSYSLALSWSLEPSLYLAPLEHLSNWRQRETWYSYWQPSSASLHYWVIWFSWELWKSWIFSHSSAFRTLWATLLSFCLPWGSCSTLMDFDSDLQRLHWQKQTWLIMRLHLKWHSKGRLHCFQMQRFLYFLETLDLKVSLKSH